MDYVFSGSSFLRIYPDTPVPLWTPTSRTSRSYLVSALSITPTESMTYVSYLRVCSLRQNFWRCAIPSRCHLCRGRESWYARRALASVLQLNTASEMTSTADSFKPTRRVRAAPGGDTHDIFGHHVDDDALASAPPRGQEPPPAQSEEQPARSRASTGKSEYQPMSTRYIFPRVFTSLLKLSFRDSVASLWDTEDKPAFKPTRR